MRSVTVAACLVAITALSGCAGSHSTSDVVEVVVRATLDGPRLSARSRGDVPLAAIRRSLPRRLPPNPRQDCDAGLTVTVRRADGDMRSFGPCLLPADIARLQQAVITAFRRARGLDVQAGSDRCGRDVITDWFVDRRIDRLYAIRCYDDALASLPSSPPAFSTVTEDLRRAELYARVGRLVER